MIDISVFRLLNAYAKKRVKGNDLFSFLDTGMNLRQMQLFALDIVETVNNDKTTIDLYDYRILYNRNVYTDAQAKDDLLQLRQLNFVEAYPDNRTKMKGTNVFKSFSYEKVYENGVFSFEWNPEMSPVNSDLQYMDTLADSRISEQLPDEPTRTLYDFLMNIPSSNSVYLSKMQWMQLLGLDEIKSYQSRASEFKNVWNKAINEINNFTSMGLWTTVERSGNRITGFTLNWPANQKIS